MSGFSSGDVSYLVQAKGSKNDEQYPGMPYMDFWGDQYEWTSLLPISWKLINTNNRVLPPQEQTQEVLAWWNTALHLLGYGLGWTNIALGLQQWRQMGYPTPNPILRFIWDTYGPSIEALEVFMVTRYDYTYPIITQLQSYGLDGFEPDEANRAEDYENTDILDDRKFIEHVKRTQDFDERWRLAPELLSKPGGYDGLHLTTHFEQYEGFIEPENNRGEIKTLFIADGRVGIELSVYRRFPARLKEVFRQHEKQLSKDGAISLYVRSLGHIGDFYRNSQTGRFFIAGEGTNIGLQSDFHLLGNHV